MTLGDILKSKGQSLEDLTPQVVEPRKRTLSAISLEISRDWKKPYFGAVPYIQAMRSLDSVTDYDLNDSGAEIVKRFLCNASRWRGETAKRVKAELRAMVGLK